MKEKEEQEVWESSSEFQRTLRIHQANHGDSDLKEEPKMQ